MTVLYITELFRNYDYKVPTKKEEATRDHGNLSSTFNEIPDQSSSSVAAAAASGGGYVPLEEVAELDERQEDKLDDKSNERLI